MIRVRTIRYLLIPALLFTQGSAFSQNLVANPGFDLFTITQSPYLCDTACWCHDWYSPTTGTPDYFNSTYNSDTNCWNGGVPENFFGTQHAYIGCAYWGLNTYAFPPFPNDREYLQSELIDSLISGVQYCVSLYVSLADLADYATCGIGVLFTDTAVENYNILECNYCLLEFNAQLNASEIISDKDNWTRISGSFIANGGERFITIGNFNDDEHTDTLWVGPPSGYVPFSYYYIDAVCVYDCSIPVFSADGGQDKYICTEGESATIETSARPEYSYSWYDATGTLLDTTATINVSPSEDADYYLRQMDFTFNVTWDTVHVHVGCGDDIYIPNIFSPNGDGLNDVLYVRSRNATDVMFRVYDRWGNLLFETEDINTGWDGWQKGKECAEGTYFYAAEVILVGGESVVKKGSVTLVR